jgi:hypothetical protein
MVVRFTPQGFGAAQGAITTTSNGGPSFTTIAALAGLGISGTITQQGGIGFPGIAIQVSSGGADVSTTTGSDGSFTAIVGPNNGYSVTPSAPGLTFTPTSRVAIVMTADVRGVDFSVDTGSQLASSILPTSRSVHVGGPATAFATLINTGATMATACSLAWPGGLPGTFLYQLTDSTTNLPIGTANTPVDIAAHAARTFVFGFTPTDAFGPLDIAPVFGCSNTQPAIAVTGLNSVLLSASATPVADIVALAATLNSDGIVNVLGATGTGIFAVATANVGVSGQITVSADTGASRLPLSSFFVRRTRRERAWRRYPAASQPKLMGERPRRSRSLC